MISDTRKKTDDNTELGTVSKTLSVFFLSKDR